MLISGTSTSGVDTPAALATVIMAANAGAAAAAFAAIATHAFIMSRHKVESVAEQVGEFAEGHRVEAVDN